jgi:hypothetical protein
MQFLLPETTVRDAGAGPAIDVGDSRGRVLILTLGIIRILEKESIDVSIWGSPDGRDWGEMPIASFPQKFYCGTYQMHLNLASRPDVQYLRVQWDAGRWMAGKGKPLFTFYLFAQAPERQYARASA